MPLKNKICFNLKKIIHAITDRGFNYKKKCPRLPVNLRMELTDRCNLNCYMCKIHCQKNDQTQKQYHDMPEEIFKKLEPLIIAAKKITFGGGGEPTVAIDFLDRFKKIKDLNPKIKLKVNTNGVNFSSLDFAKKAIPLLDSIHLSLNGVSNYEEIMIGSSLEKIKRSLKNIKLVREQLKNPPHFNLGFILMKKNICDIVPAAILAKENGAESICYKDLWVRNEEMKEQSFRHNPDLLKKIKLELLKAREIITIKYNWHGSKQPTDLKNNDSLKKIACKNPWTTAQIFRDGRVYLCCNGSTIIGNLQNDNFYNIWNGPEAQKYRQGIVTRSYYKDCAHCKYILKNKAISYER